MGNLDVTFMIKTMFRPNGLKRLLLSIRNHYPNAPIVVGDDNYTPYPEISTLVDDSPLTQHLIFTPDIGIGTVLNHILSVVETKYVVLLEDDFEFSKLTNIEKLIAHVDSGRFDIAGGACRASSNGSLASFLGNFNWNIYPIAPGPYEFASAKDVTGPQAFDVIVNFFAARTEDLIPFGWSVPLKVARHIDFFLKSGGWRPQRGPAPVETRLVSGYDPSVEIIHHAAEIEEARMRKPRECHRTRRMAEYKKMYMDIWGFLPPKEGVVET